MIGLLFAGPVPAPEEVRAAEQECGLARHGFVVEQGTGTFPGPVDTRLLPGEFPYVMGWVRVIAGHLPCAPPSMEGDGSRRGSRSRGRSREGNEESKRVAPVVGATSSNDIAPWADHGPLRTASRFAKRLLEAGGTAVVLERAGGLALEAESFLHRLGDVEDETSRPFLAWLDFGVEQAPSGAIVFRTHGMEASGLPDVEVELLDRSQTGMRRAGDAALFACLLQTQANRPLADGERVRVPTDVEFSFRGALTRGETFHEFIASGHGVRGVAPSSAKRAIRPIALQRTTQA